MEWTHFSCTLCKAGVVGHGDKEGEDQRKYLVAGQVANGYWSIPHGLSRFLGFIFSGSHFCSEQGMEREIQKNILDKNGAENSGIL